MRKIFATLLALTLIFCSSLSAGNVVLAAEQQAEVVTNTNIIEHEVAEPYSNGFIYEDSGVLEVFKIGNFTVSSKSTCSVIIATKPITSNGTVTIKIYDSRNNVYLDKVISADSSNTWRVTFPKGSYTVELMNGGGTHAYSMTIDKIG